jgi:hypothetical protein
VDGARLKSADKVGLDGIGERLDLLEQVPRRFVTRGCGRADEHQTVDTLGVLTAIFRAMKLPIEWPTTTALSMRSVSNS